MLKRLIEQEYSDLFPNEPTFICAKLQDQYGYSLSNSSFVYELLKMSDRIYAVPEGFGLDLNNEKAMHLTTDSRELLCLLRSVTQNIAAKLTEASYRNIENLEEILAAVVPLGFSINSKLIVQNVSAVIRRILETERLYIFDQKQNQVLFRQMINLLNYWVSDLICADGVLLSSTIDILELLIKSSTCSFQLKTPLVINNLMNASKLEIASAQTRSRIIRIISYLTRGEFKDTFNPRPVSRDLNAEDHDPQSRF